MNHEIPVYCGETTKIILQALGEIRRTELEFDVEGITFSQFRAGKTVTIGDLEIEPIHVDHSVPGACGFIIHTSNGAIVYTGDFRSHGAKPEMTRDFAHRSGEAEPIAAVTEATNMIGASASSEAEVESKLDSIIAQSSGIVLAEFAHADVDRLNSFFRTAKRNDRCLAVSLKQAHLLSRLHADAGLNVPSLSDKNILIFRKSKKREEKWEKQILEQYPSKIVDVFEVSKLQCKVVLALSFYDLEELVEIQPEAGSCYISSSSEPFNKEMMMDFGKLVSWLEHYGLPQYQVHVSGHVMPLQLKAILREIGSRKIFPIHTENAGLFVRFMRDLEGNVVFTKKEEQYTI
jgi:ribonuclease J